MQYSPLQLAYVAVLEDIEHEIRTLSGLRDFIQREIMPAYILRNINPDLWARVKTRSETDGIPLRAIILKLLEMYGQGEIVIKADRPG